VKDLVVADAKYTVLEERAEMAQLIQRFCLTLCFRKNIGCHATANERILMLFDVECAQGFDPK